MPTDLIITFVTVFAVLQGLSMFLTNLEIAAKRIEGRSTWIARDGTVFEEFAVTELESSEVMKQDFEETCSEAVPAGSLSLHVNG